MPVPSSCVKLPIAMALAMVMILPVWAVATAGPDVEEESRAAVDTTSIPETALHHVGSIACIDPETGLRFSPLGVAFDLHGDLYVVDADHSRLLVWTDSTHRLDFFAGCPSDLSSCRPVDVAAEAGWIYVSERSSGLLIAYDSNGAAVFTRELGPGLGGIGLGESGLICAALTLSGSVVIADVYGDKSPILCPVSGGPEGSYPVDCLILDPRRILVSDAFSKRVLILGPLGNVVGNLQGFDFKSPSGLGAWGSRLVLVADSELGCIAVFDAGGKFLGTFGRDSLKTPTFLAVRDDGTVCVADPGKMTIEVFTLEDLKLE